jgi:predicted deacylase
LFIARLPSGTEIHLPIHVFRSPQNGPVVLLSGGLHGDEVNGIEIVRRMVASKVLHKLKKGTVIAMPIINIFGFLNFSRDVPDGKDVNRSFPGNENGSLASIVAHKISTQILPQIDFGIDFHTGGASRTNYPQVRYAPNDKFARELSLKTEFPVILKSEIIPGSLREYAFKEKKSIIVYEGGESMRFDEHAIEEAIRGTLRLLKSFDMIASAPKPKHKSLELETSKWLRADIAGLFRILKKSGQHIKKGDVLGVINDIGNQYQYTIEAPEDGFIIGHNNLPVVYKGDAIFHIGIA